MKIDRHQYLSALCVAAIYSMKRFTVWQILKRAKDIALTLIPRKDKQATPEVLKARLEHCRQCPLFFAPLQTCGSPLDGDGNYGCYCYMPVKAREKDATCWADETTPELEIGWTTKKSIS
jgi:hypothetical protein